jgi:hypothetical protein
MYVYDVTGTSINRSLHQVPDKIARCPKVFVVKNDKIVICAFVSQTAQLNLSNR